MRIIKKNVEQVIRAMEMAGKKAKLIKIPSSNGCVFVGILMVDGIWVAWPDNLDDQEMKLYVEKFGDIPDICTVNQDIDEILRIVQKE